jgi:hypothetical protein
LPAEHIAIDEPVGGYVDTAIAPADVPAVFTTVAGNYQTWRLGLNKTIRDLLIMDPVPAVVIFCGCRVGRVYIYIKTFFYTQCFVDKLVVDVFYSCSRLEQLRP